MDEIAGVVDPKFALHVRDMLEGGNPADALALAQAGVEQYPWYPTGLLMLSRSYEALGRPFDALLALRKVELLLPDAPLVKDALARLEMLQAQSYEQSMQPEEVPPHPSDAPADSSGIVDPPRAEENMDTLVERLQTAGPVQPDPQQLSEEGEKVEPPPTEPGIVSATVAEIFVQQGEYGEALRTYRKIIRQHPEYFEKYSGRIDEIEEMIRKQIFE